jgi:hypothetical protein
MQSGLLLFWVLALALTGSHGGRRNVRGRSHGAISARS